jgi:hypothetical protein
MDRGMTSTCGARSNASVDRRGGSLLLARGCDPGPQSTKLPACPPPHRRPRFGVEPKSCRVVKLEFVVLIPPRKIGPALKQASAKSPPSNHEAGSYDQYQKYRSKDPRPHWRSTSAKRRSIAALPLFCSTGMRSRFLESPSVPPRGDAGGLNCGVKLSFVRYFWHTLERKSRKLIEGWPLEAICFTSRR